jgi:hypothetical protein
MTGWPARPGSDAPFPIDIGTAWVLDRGPWVGVLVGDPDDGLFEYVEQTEEALLEALRKARLRLPRRQWRRTDRNSLKAAWSGRNGSPAEADGLVFDLVLDAGTAAEDRWLREIDDCCAPYWEMMADPQAAPSALLIHVVGPGAGGNRPFAARLAAHLARRRGPGTPGAARTPWVGAAALSPYRDDWPRSEARPPYLREPGEALDGLIQQIRVRLGRGAALRRVLRDVDRARFDPRSGPGLADEVVEDLNELAGDDPRCDEELLALLDEHRPAWLRSLLGAYATRAEPGRRAALRFALDHDAAELLDAWLDGAGPDAIALEPADWPHPKGRTQWVLGLLRLMVRDPGGSAAAEIRRLLERGHLHVKLADLCRVALGAPRGEVMSTLYPADAERLRWALAADLPSLYPPDWRGWNLIRDGDCDRCWLLRALTPTPSLIDQIVGWKHTERAVLGLVNPSEWRVIQAQGVEERFLRPGRADAW